MYGFFCHDWTVINDYDGQVVFEIVNCSTYSGNTDSNCVASLYSKKRKNRKLIIIRELRVSLIQFGDCSIVYLQPKKRSSSHVQITTQLQDPLIRAFTYIYTVSIHSVLYNQEHVNVCIAFIIMIFHSFLFLFSSLFVFFLFDFITVILCCSQTDGYVMLMWLML